MTSDSAEGFVAAPPPSLAPQPRARVPDLPAWCLALLPLAVTMVEVGLKWVGPAYALSDTAVSSGLSAAMFVTAWNDAKAINALGANPRGLHLKWWGLVTPIYLVQRARALGRGWIFVAILILSLAPIVVLATPELLTGQVFFSLPRCNDATVLKKLIDIANAAYRAKNVAVTMDGVDAASETGSADKTRTCSATARFSDGEVLPIVFTVDEQGDSYWIHITRVGAGS